VSAPRLSVVIVARNEATRIGRCLASAAFADERLVVDTGSDDATVEVARRAGARVIEVAWEGFGPTKARALAEANGDWLLLLDADEEVTPELAVAIGARAATDPQQDGYAVCRRSFFLGKWMGHGGWYPDWVLRLVPRRHHAMSSAAVHESLSVPGATHRLEGELLHHTDRTLAEYLDKMVRYADLGARQAFENGRRFRWSDLLLRPPAVFWKRLLLRAGFLDGAHGVLLALLSSVHVTIKYVRLWELGRDAGPDDARHA